MGNLITVVNTKSIIYVFTEPRHHDSCGFYSVIHSEKGTNMFVLANGLCSRHFYNRISSSYGHQRKFCNCSGFESRKFSFFIVNLYAKTRRCEAKLLILKMKFASAFKIKYKL